MIPSITFFHETNTSMCLLVDVGSLSESVAHRARLLRPLGARKIHQTELAHFLSRHLKHNGSYWKWTPFVIDLFVCLFVYLTIDLEQFSQLFTFSSDT